MSINIFSTPSEVAISIAKRAKDKRLSLNLSQQTLANRSGVSLCQAQSKSAPLFT